MAKKNSVQFQLPRPVCQQTIPRGACFGLEIAFLIPITPFKNTVRDTKVGANLSDTRGLGRRFLAQTMIHCRGKNGRPVCIAPVMYQMQKAKRVAAA